MRFLSGLCLTFGLVGCIDLRADRRTLVDTAFVLGPTARTLRPTRPLRAIGPFNELCLYVPRAYRRRGDTPDNVYRVGRPDGKFVAPEVTMIAPDGQRQPFPAAGFLLGRDGQAICFETRPPRDLSRRYIAVELRADDTLQVLRVHWSAGDRYGSI